MANILTATMNVSNTLFKELVSSSAFSSSVGGNITFSGVKSTLPQAKNFSQINLSDDSFVVGTFTYPQHSASVDTASSSVSVSSSLNANALSGSTTINAYATDVTFNSTALFAIPLGMTKVNQLNYQWSTWDGSAGRTVYGYLINKQNLQNITVQISSDNLTWNSATLTGNNWTYLDQNTYSESWTYYVRCLTSDGSLGGVITQVVDYVAMPSVTFISQSFASGTDPWTTWITGSGNVFTGSISSSLPAGTILQLSVDGGATWSSASVSDQSWTYQDTSSHSTNWTLYARILDTSSLSVSPTSSKNISVISVPTITTTSVNGMTSPFVFWNESVASSKLFSGTISSTLSTNEVLQMSVDGGLSWFAISVFGLNFTASVSLLFQQSTSVKLRVFQTLANIGSAVTTVPLVITNIPSISIVSMDYDTGTSGDWITWDGSSVRTVRGTISQTPSAHDTVFTSFDNGNTWSVATVSGTNWSSVDNTIHTSSWVIQAKIVNSSLGIASQVSQQVNLLAHPVNVFFDSMDYDTGVANDWITWDGSANRVVYGHTSVTLGNDEKVMVSFDNGATWKQANTNGTQWYAVDTSSHVSSWTMQAKVVEISTNLIADQISQTVTLISPPNCTITSVTDVDSFWMTSSPLPGKIISGSINVALGTSEVVQVSLNQGASWAVATLSPARNSYSFVDVNSHTASWDIWVRIFDTTNNLYSQITTQHIQFISDPIISFVGQFLKGGENINWSMNSAQIGVIYRGTISPIYNHPSFTLKASFDGGNSWQNVFTNPDNSWYVVDATQHFTPWILKLTIFDSVSGQPVVSNYQKYVACSISDGAYTIPSNPLNTARTNIILNF